MMVLNSVKFGYCRGEGKRRLCWSDFYGDIMDHKMV